MLGIRQRGVTEGGGGQKLPEIVLRNLWMTPSDSFQTLVVSFWFQDSGSGRAVGETEVATELKLAFDLYTKVSLLLKFFCNSNLFSFLQSIHSSSIGKTLYTH